MEMKKIDVLPELLALCERVGEGAKEMDSESISWAFFPQEAIGAERDQPTQGAVGFTAGYEYNVSTWLRSDGSWGVSAYSREVGKYDNDNWETHPCDDDYEEAE